MVCCRVIAACASAAPHDQACGDETSFPFPSAFRRLAGKGRQPQRRSKPEASHASVRLHHGPSCPQPLQTDQSRRRSARPGDMLRSPSFCFIMKTLMAVQWRVEYCLPDTMRPGSLYNQTPWPIPAFEPGSARGCVFKQVAAHGGKTDPLAIRDAVLKGFGQNAAAQRGLEGWAIVDYRCRILAIPAH